MPRHLKHTEIYASELVRLRYGHPLWRPEPSADCGEVKIGDVGYIRDGAFHRLFNATSEKNGPINKGKVPDGFVPLRVPRPQALPNVIRPGDALCSESMNKTDLSLKGDVPLYAFLWLLF